MARPHKPHWHEAGNCFRSKVAGKPVYFPSSIRQFDKPLIAGVPKAAWDWLDEYKRTLARQVIDPRNLTVWAVCQAYLQWADGERAAGRSTDSNYRGHETHLAKFWDFVPEHASDRRPYGDRIAAELDPDDLKTFADAMVAGEYSPHYVSNLCKSVQAAFNWATVPVKGRDPVRLLVINPVKGYRPPKPPKSPERYIEPARLRAFLRWAWRRAGRSRGVQQKVFDRCFVRMLWFLALTGARPGEACGARWDKVDWRQGILVLEEWKNRRKTGELREIHLTPPVVRLLRRLERIAGRNQEWIFSHTLGRGQAGTAASTEGTPWNSDALAQKIVSFR